MQHALCNASWAKAMHARSVGRRPETWIPFSVNTPTFSEDAATRIFFTLFKSEYECRKILAYRIPSG